MANGQRLRQTFGDQLARGVRVQGVAGGRLVEGSGETPGAP